jgi:hypothetical protein
MNVIKFPRERVKRGRVRVTIDESVLETICGWSIDLGQRLNVLEDRLIKLEHERMLERATKRETVEAV